MNFIFGLIFSARQYHWRVLYFNHISHCTLHFLSGAIFLRQFRLLLMLVLGSGEALDGFAHVFDVRCHILAPFGDDQQTFGDTQHAPGIGA